MRSLFYYNLIIKNKIMNSKLLKVSCIALFISFAIATIGHAESTEKYGNCLGHVSANQVVQNGSVTEGGITMVSENDVFSFGLDELLQVYRKKDVNYACEFFTSKGFKNKTNDADNAVITITYDCKVMKIVVKKKEEVNPFPVEWTAFLMEEGFSDHYTKLGQFSRTDYRKIGFPIISEAIDFSVSPFLGYFYIGEQVKK